MISDVFQTEGERARLQNLREKQSKSHCLRILICASTQYTIGSDCIRSMQSKGFLFLNLFGHCTSSSWIPSSFFDPLAIRSYLHWWRLCPKLPYWSSSSPLVLRTLMCNYFCWLWPARSNWIQRRWDCLGSANPVEAAVELAEIREARRTGPRIGKLTCRCSNRQIPPERKRENFNAETYWSLDNF